MNQTAQEFGNEFVEFWNDTLADKFERYRGILMNGLSYHSNKPLDELDLEPGSRVLDIGCGWGDTAIELARQTGPDGYVLGIDCVDRFLAKGRTDAAAEGLDNIEFRAADVESHNLGTEFDFGFSRFGMMFFNNPVAAMRNIHAALKPGAQLMFIVWRTIDDNDFLRVPKEVVLQHLPQPGDDARTCGPGPFSMADQDTVGKQLEIAGFTDIDFTRNDGPVTVGDSVEHGIEFQLAIGPAGEVFREAGEEAEQKRERIEVALGEALENYIEGGKIVMPSSSWLITARAGK